MSKKTPNKTPNYCYALNLSVDKITKLVVDSLTELNLRIEPKKLVTVIQTLTNEPDEFTCRDLSVANLKELGLPQATAYKYIKVIKHINKTLSTRSDVVRMTPWVKNRLYSVT